MTICNLFITSEKFCFEFRLLKMRTEISNRFLPDFGICAFSFLGVFTDLSFENFKVVSRCAKSENAFDLNTSRTPYYWEEKDFSATLNFISSSVIKLDFIFYKTKPSSKYPPMSMSEIPRWLELYKISFVPCFYPNEKYAVGIWTNSPRDKSLLLNPSYSPPNLLFVILKTLLYLTIWK